MRIMFFIPWFVHVRINLCKENSKVSRLGTPTNGKNCSICSRHTRGTELNQMSKVISLCVGELRFFPFLCNNLICNFFCIKTHNVYQNKKIRCGRFIMLIEVFQGKWYKWIENRPKLSSRKGFYLIYHSNLLLRWLVMLCKNHNFAILFLREDLGFVWYPKRHIFAFTLNKILFC